MDNSLPNQTNDDQNLQQTQSQQQPPAQPVGSVAKEHGPIGVSVESKPEEYIVPSGAEVEPVVSPELAEHGVEVVANREHPVLSDDHRQIGIQHAKESVPVTTHPQGSIQLPMTEEDADRRFRTTKVDDSDHWFTALVKKAYEQLRFIHQTLTK